MTPSRRAKSHGAKSLKQVADFYGKHVDTMRNIFERNPDAFDAMVIGFIQKTGEQNGTK